MPTIDVYFHQKHIEAVDTPNCVCVCVFVCANLHLKPRQ